MGLDHESLENWHLFCALFANFPERASQVLNLINVSEDEILLLALNDGGAILTEEVINTFVIRLEDSVFFKARLHMNYLQIGTKRGPIGRSADAFTENINLQLQSKKKDHPRCTRNYPSFQLFPV